MADVRDAVDRVDIVINNYGVADGSDWDSSDTESWHGSYDTNVVTAVRVTQAFLPDMRAARWGRVVFVSTVGATRPGDRIPEYYAAKGALPSIAVSLAKHLAGTGITVNCVSPGVIATPRSSSGSPSGRGARGSPPTGRASSASSSTRPWRTRRGGCRRPRTSAGSSPSSVGEPAWHLNGAHLRFDGGAADAVT